MCVGGQLVDLVEQNERVFDLCLDKSVDNAPGHCGNIGLSVTADVRLVTHAAERYADVLAVHRMGDGGCYRGLAGAGRAHKTYYLVLQVGIKLFYRKKFKNSCLDLIKPLVIGVKYLFCRRNVHAVAGTCVPRYLKTGVEIAAQHGRLG